MFDVAYDVNATIAKDIMALLHGGDAARNAAIADLGHYPPTTALLALADARIKAATEDQRWWLDAATQAVTPASGANFMPHGGIISVTNPMP